MLKRRAFPVSKLLPQPIADMMNQAAPQAPAAWAPRPAAKAPPRNRRRPPSKILEVGLVGSLDYKIIEAGRADDLFNWLKDNKYSYAGDEATLNFYVQKKWLFTVMKIDTMQMKRNKDGTFDGEVTPTRFKFTSEKLVYPPKITQISVKERPKRSSTCRPRSRSICRAT